MDASPYFHKKKPAQKAGFLETNVHILIKKRGLGDCPQGFDFAFDFAFEFGFAFFK
ncbi:MAG: hypothetical protein H7832_06630 [Magnetococcus sp. DMHC-6]